MPGEDGLELTRQLKADPKTREIIILIVTSYDVKGQELRAQEAGCNGYFTKPIDTAFLPLLISQYLRGDGKSPRASR
jgi:CheY-like chemotaxis protein